MTRALEQPHFVPYGDGRRRSASAGGAWTKAYGWWSLAVGRNQSQLNGLKVTLFDKELLRITAGQRTRFLAALGMTSLEMPKASSQRPTANDQQATANDQQPTANDHEPSANDHQLSTNSKSLPGGASPGRLLVKILGFLRCIVSPTVSVSFSSLQPFSWLP
jgi:hypothetical protein